MSKRASEAAVPLWNTEQRALTMAFQLSSQCTTPHLFPSSFPSFYCILLFVLLPSLSLSQRHKFTRSISRPELSHTRLADGDLHKHVGPLLRPGLASDFRAYWLRRTTEPFHCPYSPPFPDPLRLSLPLPPLRSPPLPKQSSLLMDSELQQLNGDIRRKVEEPKPSGSSPPGWLATAFKAATVSPTPPLPFPSSLAVRSLSSPARLSSSH